MTVQNDVTDLSKPLHDAEDYFEYLQLLDEQGCPFCGSDNYAWEEEDGAHYCQNCHNFF